MLTLHWHKEFWWEISSVGPAVVYPGEGGGAQGTLQRQMAYLFKCYTSPTYIIA